MHIKDVTEANRRAWNAVAPVHRKKLGDDLTARFSTPGSSCLEPVELEHLCRIGIEGKRIAQLCCNNGCELISLMNLFDSRRDRRGFALGYRCEHADGRSPRMLVRRQLDEGIRGLLRTLQYHATKPLNLAQQLHLGRFPKPSAGLRVVSGAP